MARIRSIHPGIFTDEAFAGLSMAARVLLLGLWTEADDQGIFDWKPITLKMRIMPVDNVDVAEILTELAASNVIMKFEEEGRQLGAIRNFCKFQRPKTPKYRPLKSPEVQKYVASSYQNSEITKDKTESFPQKVEIGLAEVEAFPKKEEIPPQMEEEGGRVKEEIRKEVSRPVAKATRSDAKFEEFWQARPRRKGDDPRKPAEDKFRALVKTGVDPDLIVAGAKAAAIAAKEQGKWGTEFVPQTIKWLRDQRFVDYAAAAFSDQDEAPAIDWDAQLDRFHKGFQWSAKWYGPEPGTAGCRVPADVLAKHGYGPVDTPDASAASLRSMQ